MKTACSDTGQKVDATPRGHHDEEVLEVDGTGIKFVAAMPIQTNKLTAGLSAVDAERVERMKPDAETTMARKF